MGLPQPVGLMPLQRTCKAAKPLGRTNDSVGAATPLASHHHAGLEVEHCQWVYLFFLHILSILPQIAPRWQHSRFSGRVRPDSGGRLELAPVFAPFSPPPAAKLSSPRQWRDACQSLDRNSGPGSS